MNPNHVRLIVYAMSCIWVMVIQHPVYSQNPMALEKMMDMDLEDLLSLEVSVASKKEESMNQAPAIIVAVPREEIEIYGDRTLFELLERQPSVYTRTSYMYPNNIASFRGDMPTHLDLHNLLLFNGRPIRESLFGGMNFPAYMTFPLTGLKSVELIRGPGSVLYGTNAFTGVVNLKSRSIPEHTEVSVSGRAGSFGSYETGVSLGGRSGELGFVTDLRTAGQEGYRYRLIDERGVLGSHGDDNRSVSGTAHLEYQGFNFDIFAVNLETFHLGPLPWWSLLYHQFTVRRLFTNAGYRLPLDERTTLEFNLTYNLEENSFANTTQTVGINSSDVLGEVTFLANPLDQLNVVLGALQEYRSSYEPQEGYYQSVPSYHYSPKSAYAQADYKVHPSTKLISGAQWNESAQGYEDTVSRYGVIFTPFKKWGLKLLRGEAFRAPFALESDVYDIPILVGNMALTPETITTYDAQLFYSDEKAYAAVTYFDSSIGDIIIRDTSVSPASFKNGGEQHFRGVEFEAKYTPAPHWHVLASTLFQDNQQTADINPSTAPEYMMKVGTGYTWTWGTAAVAYTHFGKPPRLASEIVVNPEPEAINLVSVNVRLDMAQWLGGPQGRSILTLRAENLLDEDLWVPEFNRRGRPNSLPDGPGATFYAGLTLNF